MVRRGTRARLDRLIPSAYYPAVYSIASGVALTMVVVFWQPFGSPLFLAQSPARYLMHLLSLLSLAGFVWGASALRTRRTLPSSRMLSLSLASGERKM